MEATEKQKRVSVTIRLDPDVRRKLRQASANQDTRISDLVNQAVRAALGLGNEDGPNPAA